MKNLIKYSLGLFLLAMMSMFACTQLEEDIRLDPQLATIQVTDITSSSAIITGFVIAEGEEGFTERGVCYDVVSDPTIESNKVACPDSIDNAGYDIKLTGLDYVTKYYARAYAISATETLYGDTLSFTTLPEIPTVTTATVSEITGISATSGGEVTSDGGADVTAYGVVYSTDSVPTLDDMKTEDGSGLGTFTSSLTGLNGLTTYYVCAYATNSSGTAYGDILSFTTDVAALIWYVPGNYVAASYPGSDLADWSPDKSPYIEADASDPNNFEGYVYMANDNSEWKLTTAPDWDHTNYGGGNGVLDPAGGNIVSPAGYYKINANASDLTYTAVATEWGVIGDATPGGWDTDENLSYDASLQQWIGSVHISASGGFKFRANDDWPINYGSSTADENLNPDGDNIVSPGVEADYAITLDLSTPLKYVYAANYWGLIGSATPGGWDTDTDMTWDAANAVFTITIDLVAGDIKYRANDDWAINLGGDMGALTQDGANIAVSEDGNYTITLDPWNNVGTITKN